MQNQHSNLNKDRLELCTFLYDEVKKHHQQEQTVFPLTLCERYGPEYRMHSLKSSKFFLHHPDKAFTAFMHDIAGWKWG